MLNISELVEETKAYFCLDCGVCTGSCPVARIYDDFSPRRIVEKALYELEDVSDPNIWYCLGCAQCTVRCPAKIDFPEFIKLIRKEAKKSGYSGVGAHNGIFQTIMSIQTMSIKQKRNFWKDTSLGVKEKGEYFYFVGCRPYFDIMFREIGASSIDGAKHVIKILNLCGIEPVLSNDERCCGHDALWNGDEETFKRLASINIELIKESGAKKVIFSCPEGYYTFKEIYPKYFGNLPFKPVLLIDIVYDALNKGKINLKKKDLKVTYHDPCNLGRLSGVFDVPRELISAISENLFEMPRSRENAVCCGTTGWMNCSSCSKQIQIQRLKEAMDTGADTLIVACPKCEIHFKCTKSSFDIGIEIVELFDLIYEQIEGKKDE